jgi:hypothetical protein
MDDTRQQGKGGREDEMTGGGPTLVKHRTAEEGSTARVPLIRELRSRPSERCAPDSGPPPPPPPLKGRKARGV